MRPRTATTVPGGGCRGSAAAPLGAGEAESCERRARSRREARIARDEKALRQQILSIEANAHPDYGGGFRECVQALRGRTLHELLGFVREFAKLPEPLVALADSGDGVTDK